VLLAGELAALATGPVMNAESVKTVRIGKIRRMRFLGRNIFFV